VVGLGNPGDRYRRTRHNAGFMAVDVLAARVGAAGRVRGGAWVAEASVSGAPVLLVKPLSFMNGSGGPVAEALALSGGSPADLVVLVDDVALDLGVIRVRERGSHGGHNGLRSIEESLGTADFPRIRIGVRRGELPFDLAQYVLADFAADETLLVQEAVGLAADATVCLLEEGPLVAMNRFNGRRA
jgi:PTH1 family peptidyl-tRNA hydrolase